MSPLKEHTAEEIEKIAKRWFTEQRGNIVGNTTDWDELPVHHKHNIMDSVLDTLEYMEEAWSCEPKKERSSSTSSKVTPR